MRGRTSRLTAMIALVTGAVVVAAGCSSSASKSKTTADSGKTTTVSISLTPQGCAAKPAKVATGDVQFNVTNKNASAVTEAELRTSNGSKILGEQENLTPGLSGGFELTLAPGTYELNCPGASQEHWKFTVTGKSTGASWQSSPQLAAAVQGYTAYIDQQTTDLVSASQTFCKAVSAGNLNQAKILYPKTRVYYERIEPVAEIWGTLDTEIDGRWENPVTVQSQFIGFHRIEQLMWSELVKHEQQLLTLVKSAQYNPLELASGATDLVNEAATTKISGEEERYSNTDLPVFKANVDGAMEVVTLLTPYLQKKDPSLLTQIKQRDAAVLTALSKYKASPGYDDTGYVEYSTVLDTQRRQLSSSVNALAETLSKVSAQVGTA
jgi:iron uptake system component EfeO